MILLRALAVTAGLAAMMAWAGAARAINWEGHDEWFFDPTMIEGFTRELPPPIAKPMPKCSERAARARANPYEQVPVPGLNCRGDGHGTMRPATGG